MFCKREIQKMKKKKNFSFFKKISSHYTVEWLLVQFPYLLVRRAIHAYATYVTIAGVFAKFSAQADWQTRLRCDLLDSPQPAPHCKMSHHDAD